MSRGWQSEQRLFWSIGRPLKYMGLTLDEWGVTLAGIILGIVMINSGMVRLGLLSFLLGIILCYVFKKFKGVSEHFRLVSFLVALGVWKAWYRTVLEKTSMSSPQKRGSRLKNLNFKD